MGCCDLFDMERQVRIIDKKSDFLHMDVKDGVYVPSFGIGPEFLAALKGKVTIMIVDGGISGQKVIEQTYDKIRKLVKIREEKGLDFLIEADGSMNRDVYRPLYEAGADIVVLGPPALWNKAENFEEAWAIMESEMKAELSDK